MSFLIFSRTVHLEYPLLSLVTQLTSFHDQFCFVLGNGQAPPRPPVDQPPVLIIPNLEQKVNISQHLTLSLST